MSLAEKLAITKTRISKALSKSPYGQKEVLIIGASKAQSVNDIRTAAEFGILHMGENYAQELISKAPLCMDAGIRWHFIGHLQSNKVKHVLPYVSSIDCLDSVELAKKIGRVREQLGRHPGPVSTMLQVNVGNERQKAGLTPQVIKSLFSEFMAEEGISVTGLMSIPPAHKDAEKMRPFFKQVKELFDELKLLHKQPEQFRFLSMGMSADFEVAIEEGSNCIRIGESLFGPRPSK